MPKSEVGADAFLASRGPQSDGRPKLLDVRDCTGGGDVATTVVRKAVQGEDGSWTIESASGGKQLKVGTR